MQRIIDGTLYERNLAPGCWTVSTKTMNGVTERIARPARVWEEVGLAPDWMLVQPVGELDPVADADYIEERHQSNLRRAARRAKIACKWFIVQEGFDELLTLTYRDNQTDERLAKEHFAKWLRRMKAALPGFRFCAGFEPQDRGAWHIHVATHKLPEHAQYKGVKIPAWRLGTEIWRDVVGPSEEDLPNGLCFVGGKPSRWGKRRRNLGLYKMANYVSKYILKHYELVPEGKNRYSRSNGAARVKAEVLHLAGVESLAQLVACVFELADGATVVSHRAGKEQDFYILATEVRRPDKPVH